MKTHDIAKALAEMARLLRTGPNIDIEDLQSLSFAPRLAPNETEIPVALSTLVSLSRVDKQQWMALIKDLRFPVEVRPRDASRDILGKLLRYLEVNAEARKKLSESAKRKAPSASPELMSALASLLKD